MAAFILMGVSGAGKSTVGQRAAAELGLTFLEGDAFHPAHNITKMAAGSALTDEDRAPWIDALARAINAGGDDVVVACSALSHFVRERLREAVRAPVHFFFLTAPPALIRERLAQRPPHFMKPGMLDSQFEALQVPEHALRVDVSQPLEAVCAEVVQHIRRLRAAEH